MPSLPDLDLGPAQIVQLTKAMLSVASVDTIQPAEAALIGQFYDSVRTADMPTTAAFLASADARSFVPASLAGCSAEFADMVVLMCLMTGHADGKLSAAELAHVQEIATAAGVDSARFDAHLDTVRDELVASLSHLPDTASVAAVARKLNDVH